MERAKGVDTLIFQSCEKGHRPVRARRRHGRPLGTRRVTSKRNNFNCPPYHFLCQNGLTNEKTWQSPDADEKERLLGFRPDHSRIALSTSAKTWEVENARLANGDLGSFGKMAFRITPRAIGHEVQVAYGRSIFHTITRVLPDRP